MQFKKFNGARLAAGVLAALKATTLLGQGLLVVDQASGTTDEFLGQYTRLPDNQVAQSFTPSLSAVGFVQFNNVVPAFPGNDQVTFVVNLREGTYNGPILSSTTPVVLLRGPIQISTFYYPDNIPVTPGQLYFFEPVLQSPGSVDIGTKGVSSYLGGDLWSNGLPDPRADLWFREGIVVPEPEVAWLFLLGGGIFLWRRRTLVASSCKSRRRRSESPPVGH